mmetsp:Transcript_7743/g.11089  ORF Transcript_7743/g.11089 Transcript_7743/m.11089 type:complete len:293 (+) Transcript_7743:171-1049(+)
MSSSSSSLSKKEQQNSTKNLNNGANPKQTKKGHHQHQFNATKQQQQQQTGKKRIYLIRHGESLGQVASFNRMDRKQDPRLIDAGLTLKGQWQAADIPFQLEKLEQKRLDRDEKHHQHQQQQSRKTKINVLEHVELIVSSPLTRAIHTGLLGFQDRSSNSKFIIHPHLHEQGGKIPENQSRPIQHVLKDLQHSNNGTMDVSRIEEINFDLVLEAESNEHKQSRTNKKKTPSGVSAKERIRNFLLWLSQERTERVIAVVCHYNVIRSMLGPNVSPQNALPIPCELSRDGQIEPI